MTEDQFDADDLIYSEHLQRETLNELRKIRFRLSVVVFLLVFPFVVAFIVGVVLGFVGAFE